jgi:hypothetical protein
MFLFWYCVTFTNTAFSKEEGVANVCAYRPRYSTTKVARVCGESLRNMNCSACFCIPYFDTYPHVCTMVYTYTEGVPSHTARTCVWRPTHTPYGIQRALYFCDWMKFFLYMAEAHILQEGWHT